MSVITIVIFIVVCGEREKKKKKKCPTSTHSVQRRPGLDSPCFTLFGHARRREAVSKKNT